MSLLWKGRCAPQSPGATGSNPHTSNIFILLALKQPSSTYETFHKTVFLSRWCRVLIDLVGIFIAILVMGEQMDDYVKHWF